MSPRSTSRGTPSLGSSPCPRPRPSTARSITGSGGASRPCSPTSSPGASVWRTASSGTRTAWRACSWSWRWRCTGRCPPPCGRPRVSPCRPKKSPGATGAEGGPRPNLPLQARPAPHPAPPSAPDPAATPLGRLAELIGDKAAAPPIRLLGGVRPVGDRGRRSEGSPLQGADQRATTLYPVGPRRGRTMMQPCASAARLRGGGPTLNHGAGAMFGDGLPPPRIVIGGPPRTRGPAPKLFARLLLPGGGSPGRTEDDALRRLAGGHQPPQRDEQLPRQRHDHGLARAAAGVRGARPVPPGEVTVPLEAQEAPGELEHAAAHAGVAHPRQALLPPPGPALVG